MAARPRSRQAGFRDGRQVGEDLGALEARDRERAHLAFADEADCGRRDEK